MTATARIAYVVRSPREEPPKLFTASRMKLSLHEAAPLTPPLLALEDDPGLPCDAALLAEVRKKGKHAWLLAGEGPIPALLADAAASLEAAFSGLDPTGWVEDLASGRIMPGVEARNGLPGRLAKFLPVHRHVAIAPVPGGLATRGLSKFGAPELAIGCREPLRPAAALVLRRAVREALLSGKPLEGGEGRALEGGLRVAVRAAGGGPLAAARAALAEHARVSAEAASGLLPDAVEVLEVVVLDASGAEAGEAGLAAIPEEERPRLRGGAASESVPRGTGNREQGTGNGELGTGNEGAGEGAGAEAGEGAKGAGGAKGAKGAKSAKSAKGATAKKPKKAKAKKAPPAAEAFASWKGAAGPEGATGLAAIFAGGVARGLVGEPLVARVEAAGVLEAPSGRIVACDGIQVPEKEALPLDAGPGSYPVYVAIAAMGARGKRVAAAALVLSGGAPASWERAQAHDVDSGVSGFMDALVTRAVAAADDRGEEPGLALAEKFLERGRDSCVLDFPAEDGAPACIVAFTSGMGDGTYVTYVARDAGGAAVAVVTGFSIVEGDAPRDDDDLVEDVIQQAPPGDHARSALENVLMRINVDRRTDNDYGDVAEPLQHARLERRGLAGGDVSGGLEIAASLAADRLPDELAYEIQPFATDEEATAAFAWRRAPGLRVGTVRCVLERGKITLLSIVVG